MRAVSVVLAGLLGGCVAPVVRPEPPPVFVPSIADADVCRLAPRYVADPWVREFERAELVRRMRDQGCPS